MNLFLSKKDSQKQNIVKKESASFRNPVSCSIFAVFFFFFFFEIWSPKLLSFFLAKIRLSYFSFSCKIGEKSQKYGSPSAFVLRGKQGRGRGCAPRQKYEDEDEALICERGQR
jgi:hypothetical protein